MSERWRWTLVEIRCRQLILAVRPSSLPFKSNSDSTKGPVDLIIIDHVEQPSAD
jgi:hypothetical protein